MKHWSILFFNVIISSYYAYGSACCGGAYGSPSIITGDEKAQISTSLTYTKIKVENIDSNGFWRSTDHSQQVKSFTLNGAHIFKDRWQFGFSLPIINRVQFGDSYTHFSDSLLNLGYEFLPNWDYNPYKPKGISYISFKIPLGKSKFESTNGGLDSSSNGFYAFGVGVILTKIINHWDIFSSLDIHQSLDKKISNENLNGTLKPGLGGSYGIGCGYNFSNIRLGSSIIWNYEDPIYIDSSNEKINSLERFATNSFQITYISINDWTGTFSYADQTLFGNPINTSLGQSLSLNLQTSWPR